MNSDTNTLLMTKLHAPRWRKRAVARPELMRLLDQGLERKWILVAAVAGAGKTSLVVEWIQKVEQPVCWLSLDEDDSDPARFLAYLIAAIQTKEPTIGQDLLPLLATPHFSAYDELLTSLINQLAGLSDGLIIILDDYHLVTDDQVHQALTYLLSHSPESITFALSTRMDPPFPLARMRINGDLVEVRMDALNFTEAETAQLFNQSFDLDLSAEQVAKLQTRTEGWIAGLQLAGLALQSRKQNNAIFIDNFAGSHRHILDYLMEEVLRVQPEPMRDFMIRISPLNQFSVALCNAILDESTATNAAVMLDYLETHNLFLVPLDNRRQWYRYHHLFASLLRDQLEKQQPDAASQIQQRAATWFEAQGDYETAINYASDAGAFEQAAGLMQQYLIGTYWQTPLHTWRRWYQRLPKGFFDEHVHWGFLSGAALLMRGFVEDALGLWRQVDPEQLEIDTRLIYEFMNIDEVHDVQSYAALEEAFERCELSAMGQVMLAGIVGLQGDYLRACDMVDNAYATSLRTEDPILIAALGPHRTRLYSLAGRLQDSRELSETLLEQMRSLPPRATDIFSALFLLLGRSLLAQNEVAEAESILRQGIHFVENGGFLAGILPAETMLLAEALMAQGDDEGARIEAQRAITLSERHELRGESEWLQAYQIQILLRQGDLAAATKWLQEQRPLPPPRFLPRNIRRLVEAQIYLAQNRTGRAITLLTELTTEPQNLHTVDAWLLLALARQAAGDGQHALIALTTAISMAEPETNLRAFLNQADLHAKPLVRLLKRFSQEQPQNGFVQNLLSLLPQSEEEAAAQSNLLEPLSERELEVLGLIVAGYSNKEIAEELFLALNTVKWYIKALYGKLHVSSRSRAIARAHELGLGIKPAVS